MAGQSIERRDTLRMLAIASSASTFPGFARWSFAQAPPQQRAARYQPQFFTAAEYATLEHLTDIIIPSDGTPGAREAGVSEFIDFMVWSDPALQYRFRTGLRWLDAHSRNQHGQSFRDLAAARQNAMLETLAYTKRYQPGQEDGRAFFRLLRDYTVMGFYTTRIGFEALDAPNLRMYTDSPACPHTGDPEHLRLKR
ncbi:MAG TPA: gluconate 2-dehydrogenase subunit 3 family protein [Bryobacteraceae bacterium]|nr:gluconate 2-dehydrogenase subunit 3 family protein [Bryobacteraceae bacterium]